MSDVDWKSAFLKRVGQFRTKFHVDGNAPANHFRTGRSYS